MSKAVIAVDGPAGSGKSTIARALAERLGVRHIDTGAMYRALALKMLNQGSEIADDDALPEVLRTTRIRVGDGQVLLDGEEVGAMIRSLRVTEAASRVATLETVRTWMVRRQRELIASGEGAVVEGRDIGTVVLPDADLKIYLTASEQERARRRAAQTGAPAEEAAVQIAGRDARDINRTYSPLKVAGDAVEVDTTDLTIPQVVEHILQVLATASSST